MEYLDPMYMVLWARVSHPPNSISIDSSNFAGLTNVTNRQIKRQTMLLPSVAIGCIYAMHAM